jgi:hypothetical protein
VVLPQPEPVPELGYQDRAVVQGHALLLQLGLPEQDRLVTGWSVAVRVASYLLPSTEDGGPGFSGIPGLRFAGVTRTGIELVHLPTGGRLELHDKALE